MADLGLHALPYILYADCDTNITTKGNVGEGKDKGTRDNAADPVNYDRSTQAIATKSERIKERQEETHKKKGSIWTRNDSGMVSAHRVRLWGIPVCKP